MSEKVQVHKRPQQTGGMSTPMRLILVAMCAVVGVTLWNPPKFVPCNLTHQGHHHSENSVRNSTAEHHNATVGRGCGHEAAAAAVGAVHTIHNTTTVDLGLYTMATDYDLAKRAEGSTNTSSNAQLTQPLFPFDSSSSSSTTSFFSSSSDPFSFPSSSSSEFPPSSSESSLSSSSLRSSSSSSTSSFEPPTSLLSLSEAPSTTPPPSSSSTEDSSTSSTEDSTTSELSLSSKSTSVTTFASTENGKTVIVTSTSVVAASSSPSASASGKGANAGGGGGLSNTNKIVVGVVVGIGGAILVGIIGVLFYLKKRSNKQYANGSWTFWRKNEKVSSDDFLSGELGVRDRNINQGSNF